MSTYYEVKPTGDEEEDEESEKILNIFESLPYILHETLFELNALFAELKTNVAFEQNILVTKLSNQGHDETDEEEISLDEHSIKLKEMCHVANNRFMSYLLVNSLILGNAHWNIFFLHLV